MNQAVLDAVVRPSGRRRRAAARLHRRAAAPAGIGGDKLEPGRERRAARGARHGDRPVLERLAERLDAPGRRPGRHCLARGAGGGHPERLSVRPFSPRVLTMAGCRFWQFWRFVAGPARRFGPGDPSD